MLARRMRILGVLLLACLLAVGFLRGVWMMGEYGAHFLFSKNAPTGATHARDLSCYSDIKKLGGFSETVNMGDAYFGGEKGYDLGCARVAYESALRINPKGAARAWHQLGRIDFLEGKFDDAIDIFTQQQAYFGDTIPNVHYMLGLTYGYKARQTRASDDWHHAEAEFLKYIALDPQSPWARTDLAWIYFAQGKYQEMKKPLEEGLLAHPAHAWLLNMYGLALLNTDDREGARLYFEAAVRVAQKLTKEEWGVAYPGNNPEVWEQGLAEMRASLENNLRMVTENATAP